MDKVTFEILRIHAGWFDVRFFTAEKSCCIGASDAWDNDSPQYFLQMLNDLLAGNTQSGYVVFDEEPGTYIVCIEKEEINKLTVSYSKLDNHEWTEIEVHGNLSYKALEKIITIEKVFLVVEDFDLHDFAKSVVDAFGKYTAKHDRDKYEGNWMMFPKEELEKLRSLVSSAKS